MKLIITSGYFNPLHSGHVSYLEEAKKLGDKLLVIINNDIQVRLKGAKEFLEENERDTITKALRSVDFTIISSSRDKTVGSDLVNIRKKFPKDKLIFAKGGDRNMDNLPQSEIDACKNGNIEMIFNVGCAKVQSSSKLLGKVR